MNSLGNTNFRFAIYKLKLVGVTCVDFCQKYFEKKFFEKNLWFSSKNEFSSKTSHFRTHLHPPPFRDLFRIEALTFANRLSHIRGRPVPAPKSYEDFSDMHFLIFKNLTPYFTQPLKKILKTPKIEEKIKVEKNPFAFSHKSSK